MGLARIAKGSKLRTAASWLLLGVVLAIVIAPSVDLRPTVLRTVHLSDVAPFLMVAAGLGTALVSPLLIRSASECVQPAEEFSPADDLVLFMCVLRC